MDERTQDFIDTFRSFMSEVVNQATEAKGELSPLGELVQQHLGADIAALPAVTQPVAAHRLVDSDLALAALAKENGATPIGVSGGQARDQAALPELLLSTTFVRFGTGPVDYLSVADGPDSVRRVMSFGLYLLHYDGTPLAVLQRAAKPERGRAAAAIEVLTADPDVASAFIEEFKRLMLKLSVLRGQVLSFTGNDYGNGAAGAMFLPRPTVRRDDVILAPGVLEAVTRHVVGVGEQRERLLEAGQHLKRGVLLYGPPGTGKTLTVRHLLTRTPGTTAVLLTGTSIRFITEAAELARAMQPAIVVLEDVDLVASERGMHGPQPLLFAVLDALDGLDGDADVAFVLTTNRVEVLERALAERPGRVDLAVEIALPDDESRRRLFRRYAEGLPLSGAALDAAADRAGGTTGSFAKELIRRAVLTAAEAQREVTDDDLAAALDDLVAGSARLTRSLLGGSGQDAPDDSAAAGPGAPPAHLVTRTAGWTAYSPGSGMTFGPQ
jgi:DNA polymerase III delta prime subunit